MTAISSNGTGGGQWDTGASWTGGSVPGNNDIPTVLVTDTINFDADQSAFANGLAGLVIDGTLTTDSGADLYMKVNSDVTGSGDWYIDDGASGDFPDGMVIDLCSGSNSIIGVDLHFRCIEPTYQYVRLSALEAAGQTVLSVDTDVTGDTWKDGDIVKICNIDNAAQVEERTIAAGGIAATTITVTAGLTAAKLEGAYIVLKTRNIRIINSTDYVIKSVTDSVIGAEISNVTNGFQYCNNNTIYGTLNASSYGIQYCDQNDINGAIVGPTGYGIRSSNNNNILGIIAGNVGSFYSSYSNRITGVMAGNSSVSSAYSALNIFDGATIIGNTHGLYGGEATFIDCIMNNQYNLNTAIRATLYNTLFEGGVEFYNYDDTSRAPWDVIESFDHDQVAGAYKAAMRGGIVTSDTGTKPTGEVQSYKHACEDADYPVFMQQKVLIQPGDTFSYTVYVRKDASMSWLPRTQLIIPEEDPLIDSANTPLDEAIMTNSLNTWEELELTYTNSTDYPMEVILRTLAKNATDNVWFLAEGGYLADVVEVSGSSLDSVSNDETGTSATLTITPPATGLYSGTKTRYRKYGDTDWTDGETYTGSQGVQGTHQITGLSNNTIYEFFVIAYYSTSHAFPSAITRCWINDGSGTIEERIMDEIQATLEGITTDDGFSQTIAKVVRRKGTPWTEFTTYPSIDFWLMSENKSLHERVNFQECHMIIDIGAYTSKANPDQALAYLAADIEKALMVDHTRGGLAIDTNITEHEHVFGEENRKPSGAVFVNVDIHYIHKSNDPYNK